MSGWKRSQSGGSEVAACSHGTPSSQRRAARPRSRRTASRRARPCRRRGCRGRGSAGMSRGQLVARDGLQGDVLVIDRGRRDERADHLGDARRPHARGVHDELRVDGVARPRRARGDLAAAARARTRSRACSGGCGRRASRAAPASANVARMRIEVTRHPAGTPRRTASPGEIAGSSRRASSAEITLDVQAHAARPARGPLELLELLRRRGQPHAARPPRTRRAGRTARSSSAARRASSTTG